jgi:hypothetical protein
VMLWIETGIFEHIAVLRRMRGRCYVGTLLTIDDCSAARGSRKCEVDSHCGRPLGNEGWSVYRKKVLVVDYSLSRCCMDV